ncbi:MAG: DUF2628 domain-containing protein [Pseudomonadota bacterium]
MTAYCVFLPPTAGDNELEMFRLVPDTKAPWALIAPPIWLTFHKLWLELLVYAGVMMTIAIIASWQLGTAVLYLSAIPGLYLFLEGNQFLMNRLERAGWRFAATVEGENRDEAEIRYIAEHGDGARAETASVMRERKEKPQLISTGRSTAPAPALGLFPE